MEVFIDREPAKERTQSEKEDDIVRSKLLPRSYGPFKVITADETTVTIDQDGIPNKVSIDRVTKVPQTTGTDHTDDERGNQSNDTEYAVDRIIEHRDEPDGTPKYRIRWFRYDQSHDTFEPEANIPTHFIIRYWNRSTIKQDRSKKKKRRRKNHF